MQRPRIIAWAKTVALAFCADASGANAVEFALVAFPFLLLILFVLQIGIYFMTKSALDSGIVQEAENLRNVFNTGLTPNLQTCATIKTNIAAYSGAFVNSGTVQVDLVSLASLDAATVAITDCNVTILPINSPLALRAQYSPNSFLPGFPSTLTLYSSALVRRSAQ